MIERKPVDIRKIEVRNNTDFIFRARAVVTAAGNIYLDVNYGFTDNEGELVKEKYFNVIPIEEVDF